MDDEGYLRIVDRKKELIITSGGKNISPANLEAALKMIPLVGQACAIGDNRKYISALRRARSRRGTDVGGHRTARASARCSSSPSDAGRDRRHPGGRSTRSTQQFAQVEQIKRFTVLGEEWLPDSDVLTPTSKLKRRGIHARYAKEIEAMYH